MRGSLLITLANNNLYNKVNKLSHLNEKERQVEVNSKRKERKREIIIKLIAYFVRYGNFQNCFKSKVTLSLQQKEERERAMLSHSSQFILSNSPFCLYKPNKLSIRLSAQLPLELPTRLIDQIQLSSLLLRNYYYYYHHYVF